GISAAYVLDSLEGGKGLGKRKAFAFSQMIKNWNLFKAFEIAKTKRVSYLPDSLLSYERKLQNRILSYRAQFATTEIIQNADDSARAAFLQKEIMQIHAKLLRLEEHIQNKYPYYYDLAYKFSTSTIEELQAKIIAPSISECAVIEYFWDPWHTSSLYIFYVDATQFQVFRQPLPLEFARWLEDIFYSLCDSQSFSSNTYVSIACNLFQKLLGPIKNYIKNKKLIIIPDHHFLHLPFEALISELPNLNTEQRVDYKSISYLVRQTTISYQYSANLLLKQHKQLQQFQKKIATPTSPSLLTIAPIFKDNTSNYFYHDESLHLLANYIISLSNQRILNYYNKRIEFMPGEEEVKVITSLFEKRGKKVHLFLHKAANEANLKSIELSDFQHIVFATHAVVPQQVELVSLFLAQDTTIETEDNILYANETYGLNLAAELVAIANCHVEPNARVHGLALLNLAQGFFYAGAYNLLLSLWNPGGNFNFSFLSSFYKKRLYTTSNLECLRQTKLQLLQNDTTAHPYYWAPFVYIGFSPY
ncbi:MAG: CHAT domain-containing protein, partial [Bacteroidia bacterium]|nr:CHAT domain-containing protein [Bacteroidia bacterium]